MDPFSFQKVDGLSNALIVKNNSSEPVIQDVQTALDLIASYRYASEHQWLIIYKEDITEDFFDLKTRIAGEILQKFVTYSMCIAIIGDFSIYESKSLKDFIYECNNGNGIYFADSLDTVCKKLA